jgi:hypothetical protein
MARYGTNLAQGIPSTRAGRLAVQRSEDSVDASTAESRGRGRRALSGEQEARD